MEKAKFSEVAFMMKLKERSNILTLGRKEKAKRLITFFLFIKITLKDKEKLI